MAKKAGDWEELVLEALERALAAPAAKKLHGTKANPGVFLSASAGAKAAAQYCLDHGLLEKRGEAKTRATTVPLYAPTPAAVRYLVEHDPLRRLLAATQGGVEELVRFAATWQHALEQLRTQLAALQQVVRAAAERLEPRGIEQLLAGLPQTPAAPERSRAGQPAPLRRELAEQLRQHKRRSPLKPLDLPQLYQLARARDATLTLGEFHDLVRQMAAAKEIRLSPFTQAMYQLPEPECAMIVGREVMYYVDGV